MRRFVLLSVLVVFGGTAAHAFDLRTDSEGDVVRWTHPLVLTIDSRLATQLHEAGASSAILKAIEHVDEATPALDVRGEVGAAQPIGYTVGSTTNTNSVIVLEDWPYAERALAVTLVTLNARTNELLDADVAFNADEHRFRVLSGMGDGHAFDDVQNTMTHELGHVLGLMHNNGKEDLVMFPSAPPGEVLKRLLKQDDRDGLLTLYTDPVAPVVSTPVLPAQGCSSSPTTGGCALLALALLVLTRRSRVGVAAAAVVSATSFAAVPELDGAQDVARVTVTNKVSFVHPRHPGLFLTRLTVRIDECLRGSCQSELTTVIVPGGRLGDLEQVVVHAPVPLEGQAILVARKANLVRMVPLEAAEFQPALDALRRESRATPADTSPQPVAPQVRATIP